jgi:hypothetical protein
MFDKNIKKYMNFSLKYRGFFFPNEYILIKNIF